MYIFVKLVYVELLNSGSSAFRLKKAMDLLKEASAFALVQSESNTAKLYKIMETLLENWSSEFQSKKNLTKEEIEEFFEGKI